MRKEGDSSSTQEAILSSSADDWFKSVLRLTSDK